MKMAPMNRERTVEPGQPATAIVGVELIEDGLPSLPHHHDGQGLPLQEAVALVGRVRAGAE